ncbi:uncharacterized protein LOC143146912 [Ptiloglossa arizonensis]|uniref:uncharacterized protein LOC143146912 n=1 Tax=Ptiloglossa arizonensis TaxID=3350558 RepID=UPI003FA14E10
MTGRCRTFNARDKGGIIRKIKEGSRVSGSKSVVMLNEGNGVSVHPEKVRGVLREGSYNGRIARRKPYISSTNRMKRLEFAKHDGRVRVRRKQKEEPNSKHLQPTVKQSDGDVFRVTK